MLEEKEEKVNIAFCLFCRLPAVGYLDGTVKLLDLEWLLGSSDLTTGVEPAMVWPIADNIPRLSSTGTAKLLHQPPTPNRMLKLSSLMKAAKFF